MTQEQLDLIVKSVEVALDTKIGDYKLVFYDGEVVDEVRVANDKIINIELPYYYLPVRATMETEVKIVFQLIERIIENGSSWTQEDEDYWQDRKENEEENNWESKRDYKD